MGDFEVTDLASAERVMKRIGSLQKEIVDKKEQAAVMKADIDAWLKSETEEAESKLLYYQAKIQPFITNQIAGTNKKSISLPSGRAGFRAVPPSITYMGKPIDNKDIALVERVMKFKPDCVKKVESVDWANLKKTLNVVIDKVCDENGEILDGFKAEQQEPKFYVSVKGE